MSKKVKIDVYEIVQRSPFGDTVIFGSTDIKAVAKIYRKMGGDRFKGWGYNQFPRLKKNGEDVPMHEADKLMRYEV